MDLFKLLLTADVSVSRHYVDQMYAAVPFLRQQAYDDLKARAEAEGWDYGDFSAEVDDLAAHFDFNLPKILGYSFLIYLHSLVEVTLADLAREARRQKCLALKHNELSGSSIERVRIYLTKVAALPASDMPGWSALRDLAKVRDVIVHRGGRLGDDAPDRTRLRELAFRYPGLIDASQGWDREDSELQVNPELCRHFASIATSTLEALADLVRPSKRA